jgi:hypothetical protein
LSASYKNKLMSITLSLSYDGDKNDHNTQDIWKSFVTKAERFVEKTGEHVLQGINPGGVYQAIWCRDASYILRDWFMSGNIDGTMQQIFRIWSHQIIPNREKIVFGRGSPDMKFLAEAAEEQQEKTFAGALPTTIYQAGFSEVYGQNPDIDSTALMISTTSWILSRSSFKDQENNSVSGNDYSEPTIASEHSSNYISSLLSKIGITNPSKITEFVVPCMLNAVEYLRKRDIDDDGLLEQSHNEDWMDTALRAGKIIYSQACWILALNDLSILLAKIGRYNDAVRLSKLAYKAISAVDKRLWSEENGCYLDEQQMRSGRVQYTILTQDISLYIVAITENTHLNSLKLVQKAYLSWQQVELNEKALDDEVYQRALKTLEAIKSRAWKEKWPLITESELKSTGPWVLKPYEYHNHTFWPWITGIEMLARSRFDKAEDCDILLSKLASEGHPHTRAFYEWINPLNDQGNGAYPFRTGISAVRIAIADILGKNKRRKQGKNHPR